MAYVRGSRASIEAGKVMDNGNLVNTLLTEASTVAVAKWEQTKQRRNNLKIQEEVAASNTNIQTKWNEIKTDPNLNYDQWQSEMVKFKESEVARLEGLGYPKDVTESIIGQTNANWEQFRGTVDADYLNALNADMDRQGFDLGDAVAEANSAKQHASIQGYEVVGIKQILESPKVKSVVDPVSNFNSVRSKINEMSNPAKAKPYFSFDNDGGM